MKADYSEYLMDPAHLENEEAEWARQQFYLRNAEAVIGVLKEHDLSTVVEFGCGTGLVASQLYGWQYWGFDKNPNCIKKAEENSRGRFRCVDIREMIGLRGYDLVCSFAFLKHFSLHEWDDILKIFLGVAKYGLFAVAISDHDLDDGTEYPHTSVTLEHLDRAVAAAGHKIIKTRHEADSATGYEMLVWTERV